MDYEKENEAQQEIILSETTNSILIKNIDIHDEVAFNLLNEMEESNRMETIQEMIHLGALEIKGNHCIVCEMPLKGTTYTCPTCNARYCIRCAIELSKRHEACRTCNNELL